MSLENHNSNLDLDFNLIFNSQNQFDEIILFLIKKQKDGCDLSLEPFYSFIKKFFAHGKDIPSKFFNKKSDNEKLVFTGDFLFKLLNDTSEVEQNPLLKSKNYQEVKDKINYFKKHHLLTNLYNYFNVIQHSFIQMNDDKLIDLLSKEVKQENKDITNVSLNINEKNFDVFSANFFQLIFFSEILPEWLKDRIEKLISLENIIASSSQEQNNTLEYEKLKHTIKTVFNMFIKNNGLLCNNNFYHIYFKEELLNNSSVFNELNSVSQNHFNILSKLFTFEEKLNMVKINPFFVRFFFKNSEHLISLLNEDKEQVKVKIENRSKDYEDFKTFEDYEIFLNVYYQSIQNFDFYKNGQSLDKNNFFLLTCLCINKEWLTYCPEEKIVNKKLLTLLSEKLKDIRFADRELEEMFNFKDKTQLDILFNYFPKSFDYLHMIDYFDNEEEKMEALKLSIKYRNEIPERIQKVLDFYKIYDEFLILKNQF